ncbi:MAG: hypothetical protein KatS3mg011_1296 [Acidimicrobiia bacterium]|jgi:formylglycine-generating enzyme required for sulfatase activity|nr:MAG: hypothetical protein KatS3mg011_1296 [Acidimicrobiia bacterium]
MRHLVELGDGVRIGLFPVTVGEYSLFVRAGGRSPSVWQGDEPPRHLVDHPVTDVSWFDAMSYCRWFSDRLGWEVRLPTGDQWTTAAGGSDGRLYPWGDVFDPSRCNTWESGDARTTPVDAHPDGRSPLGVWDLAGNVWEWTAEADRGGWRALRGGSWYDTGPGVCIARRLLADPCLPTPNVGFRVVVVERR